MRSFVYFSLFYFTPENEGYFSDDSSSTEDWESDDFDQNKEIDDARQGDEKMFNAETEEEPSLSAFMEAMDAELIERGAPTDFIRSTIDSVDDEFDVIDSDLHIDLNLVDSLLQSVAAQAVRPFPARCIRKILSCSPPSLFFFPFSF